MSTFTFCQVTQQLPIELKQVIWKLSRPPTFEEWMDSINTILWDTHRVVVSDLPDEPFVDYYEDSLTPQDVVDIMVEDAFLF